MNTRTLSEHDLLAPTMPGGRKRAVALAVLAHLALLAALTWGVNWKTSADQPVVEAELWSAVPQQAAPHPVAPPPPPPPPAPVPQPAPVPAPPPPKVQEPPQPSEADIALEREKKRKEEEKKHQAELAAQQRAQAEKVKAEQEEKQKQQALAAQQAKAKADKEKADKAKAEQAAKAAEQEKQRKLAEDKRKAEADAKRAEALRQDQLKRMQSLAAATGTADQTSSPRQGKNSSGGSSTSPGYGGLVAAKVKPNIVFPDAISGNPRAEVQVQASPDGTIVNVRLTTSSGNAAWDDAVVRALYKTETLPRDVDGRVPSSLIIGFRPKD